MISGHFCHHTGCCNGLTLGISFDDRDLSLRQSRYGHSIIEQDLRLRIQFPDCLPHGFIGRLQNIDLIDPLLAHNSQSYCHCFFHDLLIEKLPAALGQLLGIIQIQDLTILWKNHCSCPHRTCQWASANFIYSTYNSQWTILSLINQHPLQAFQFCLQLPLSF